jgi:hypothetical protein
LRTCSHLKPGAYCELQCIYPLLHCDDNSSPRDSNLFRFSQHAREASALINTPLDAVASYASYLNAAGFENVVETRYKLPSGPWPKDKRMKLIGAFEMHNLLRGLSGMCLRMFSKGFGWTRDEIEIYLVGVRKDIQNMSYHTYWDLYVLYPFSYLSSSPFLLRPHPLGFSPGQVLQAPMTCSNMLARHDHC